MTDPNPKTSSRLLAVEEAFAPREYFAEYLKLAGRVDSPVTSYLKMYYGNREVIEQMTNVDVRLAEMDRHAVDMHVLSITAPGVQAFDAQLGSDLAIVANDQLASIIRKHPTRFAGLAAIAPQSPESSAREIKRAMTQLGLNGIIINSHTHGEFLDNPKFSPLLEAAVEHDAPIYLHPNFPADSMIQPYTQYGMMGALWGFQAECSLHVVRMILGGVFDRYPQLKIVLGHLGEGLPYWLGRLDNRYQNILRRGGLKLLGTNRLERLPSEYFRTNFFVTTSGMASIPPLLYCIDQLGPDRVLFAIDYPFEQTEEAVSFIRSAPLSPEVLRKVTHGNAERLFGIPPG